MSGAGEVGPTLSVVIPTLSRPEHIRDLLEDFRAQTLVPDQVIVVDGAGDEDRRTDSVVREVQRRGGGPELLYLRSERGTALQRNMGIDHGAGRFIALIDDDIRLEHDFFERCVQALREDDRLGAVCGLITDQLVDADASAHWRWMRRLRCFGRFEPGHFDAASGHPIPRYLGGLHDEQREIEVMGAGCAVWRRVVFDAGLRFDPWFTGYGMLEDVHLSIRAARDWTLLELGRARCSHLKADEGRPEPEELAFRSVVSYRYLFEQIVPEPTVRQRFRWWYTQLVDLLRIARAAGSRQSDAGASLRGKLRGIVRVRRGLAQWQPEPSAQ